jgi:hypothetical protein
MIIQVKICYKNPIDLTWYTLAAIFLYKTSLLTELLAKTLLSGFK